MQNLIAKNIGVIVSTAFNIILGLIVFIFITTTTTLHAQQEDILKRLNASEKLDAALSADNATLKEWLNRVEKKLDNALYNK